MEQESKKRGVRQGAVRGKYRSRKRRIGGDRPLYKLTEDDVKVIWQLLLAKELTQEAIATLYNVGQEAISHINTGSRWCEVTGLPRRNKASTEPPPSGFAGRPRSNYIRTLRHATKRHYTVLQDAAIHAILSGSGHVKITLPTLFAKPEGFPSLMRRKVVGNNQVGLVSARTLLTWLHENGHSKYSVKDMDKMSSQLNFKLKMVDSELGIDLFKTFMEDGELGL